MPRAFYTTNRWDSSGDRRTCFCFNQECFIVQYEISGEPVVARSTNGYIGRTFCELHSLAVMRRHVVAVGRYAAATLSSILWGTDVEGASVVLTSTVLSSNYDAYIVAFDQPSLFPRWARMLKGTSNLFHEAYQGVAVDDYYSEIYAVGHFGSSIRVPIDADPKYQLNIGSPEEKACLVKCVQAFTMSEPCGTPQRPTVPPVPYAVPQPPLVHN